MSKIKSYFQNENRKIVEFPDMIDEKQTGFDWYTL